MQVTSLAAKPLRNPSTYPSPINPVQKSPNKMRYISNPIHCHAQDTQSSPVRYRTNPVQSNPIQSSNRQSSSCCSARTRSLRRALPTPIPVALTGGFVKAAPMARNCRPSILDGAGANAERPPVRLGRRHDLGLGALPTAAAAAAALGAHPVRTRHAGAARSVGPAGASRSRQRHTMSFFRLLPSSAATDSGGVLRFSMRVETCFASRNESSC